MYEDVSQDYAKKTVTMGSHPHIPGPQMASIHPCKYVNCKAKILHYFAHITIFISDLNYIMNNHH